METIAESVRNFPEQERKAQPTGVCKIAHQAPCEPRGASISSPEENRIKIAVTWWRQCKD